MFKNKLPVLFLWYTEFWHKIQYYLKCIVSNVINKFENRTFSVNDFTATISPPSSNHDWTDIFKPANLSPSNGLIFVKSQRGVPVCTVLDLT